MEVTEMKWITRENSRSIRSPAWLIRRFVDPASDSFCRRTGWRMRPKRQGDPFRVPGTSWGIGQRCSFGDSDNYNLTPTPHWSCWVASSTAPTPIMPSRPEGPGLTRSPGAFVSSDS
jgi:hypothetical protein